MVRTSIQPDSAASARGVRRVGCVSFLNAVPLIAGLSETDAAVRYDVPSRLLTDLESGAVDIALCPVIDYQRSAVPLRIVPVGGIGCEGHTLTVRLFSQVPLDRITTIHADTDSHTSVALVQVLLHGMFSLRPRMVSTHMGSLHPADPATDWPQTMLMIGDKVVTDSPPAVRFPYQLDLGDAWRDMTGLPFVFAVWMARQDADLGDLPERLRTVRETNATRIDALAMEHSPRHNWPYDMALQYLGHWLKYDIGPRQLEAMNLFFDKAHALGLCAQRRSLA